MSVVALRVAAVLKLDTSGVSHVLCQRALGTSG